MKLYVGHGAETSDWWVEVQTDTDQRPLEHHVRHSPDGFSWGYEGSAPAELALALLWDATGEEPERAMYQAFKREVIANLQRDRNFQMSVLSVLTWVRNWHRDHPSE
jgi:Family of unknown function (DUF6166)